MAASCSLLLCTLLVVTAASHSEPGTGAIGRAREGSLLQTWNTALGKGGASEQETPVTRVVNLLKEMGKTLEKEMEEDEELYHKLACWCNANEYEKDNAISASTSKIAELDSSISGLTAKVSELKLNIKELETDVANDKQALGEATALREKQIKAFHSEETDSIQAIEQLKAAIEVLEKHHTAPPESTVDGGAIFKGEKDSWSFLSTRAKGFPWSDEHTETELTRSLDDFMRNNGFDTEGATREALAAGPRTAQKFLQQGGRSLSTDTAAEHSEVKTEEWTSMDTAVVNRALKTAAAFMQAHHSETYMPAYTSRSGEIVGVLKQLREEMEDGLSTAQKEEKARAEAFAELRAAKTAQIENGERMAEQKEDELADSVNGLAEAKEDMGKEQATLAEDQQFLNNLKGTCAEADKNFQERKGARLAEMQAVAETIEILQQDNARDAISGTYSSFLQVSSDSSGSEEKARHQAAEALRAAAKKAHSPQLSIMATSVELDAFTKVKQAIDDMIAMLKQQQADEVKKSDWCKAELQSNEMATAKTTDHKADLESKMSELSSNIKALEDGVADAKSQIAQLELDLQRASENRKGENLDFQKTVADQVAVVEVLKKALDKLATYYDFLQTKGTKASSSSKQTPPVPQKEYEPSKSAPGVMEMIEKLIHEAQALMADSRKSEGEAQAAYEQSVADTNGSVQALSEDILAKNKAKGKATKALLQTKADLADTEKELEGLAKYDVDLHAECDYLLKNFDVRQTGRGQEIEALQQAKQILSGAALS